VDACFSNCLAESPKFGHHGPHPQLQSCIDPRQVKTPDWFRGTALPWLLRIKPSVVNPPASFGN